MVLWREGFTATPIWTGEVKLLMHMRLIKRPVHPAESMNEKKKTLRVLATKRSVFSVLPNPCSYFLISISCSLLLADRARPLLVFQIIPIAEPRGCCEHLTTRFEFLSTWPGRWHAWNTRAATLNSCGKSDTWCASAASSKGFASQAPLGQRTVGDARGASQSGAQR